MPSALLLLDNDGEGRYGMNMDKIRARAARLELRGVGKLRKGELVRRIQEAEGNNPCFGADWRATCGEAACCWREDCQAS